MSSARVPQTYLRRCVVLLLVALLPAGLAIVSGGCQSNPGGGNTNANANLNDNSAANSNANGNINANENTNANTNTNANANTNDNGGAPPTLGRFIAFGYNELGMHCMNQDFSEFMLLPPYNNLRAQILERGGEDPRIVTSGVTVNYTIPSNTHSSDKTNFWTYAQALLGATPAPDVGLTGHGLSGTMALTGGGENDLGGHRHSHYPAETMRRQEDPIRWRRPARL